MKKPYGLYSRRSGKKSYYYVRFVDPETNERLSAISTGCTKKADAERFAVDMLKKGIVSGRNQFLFKNFTKDFFSWERSEYIRKQLASGARLSRTYVDNSFGILQKHLLPEFSELHLNKITVKRIEDFIDKLVERYALPTVKNILVVLATIMGEAYRVGHIDTDPMKRVKKPVPRYESRGILPVEVIKKLLFGEDVVQKVWGSDASQYCINLIAFSTGMRQGEILGLRWQDLKADFIAVDLKWQRKYGLEKPKYESSRSIPIPQLLREVLAQYKMSIHPSSDESFVFASNLTGKPLDHKVVISNFYKALDRIGFDKDLRQKHNITFHSWRHTFTSLMRNRINDNKLKLLTGHKSINMLDNYTHHNIDSIRDVIGHQNDLIQELSKVS